MKRSFRCYPSAGWSGSVEQVRGRGEMSALVAQLLTLKKELAIELQRFILLWRYQNVVPPFTLWWRLVFKRFVDVACGFIGLIAASPIMGLIAIAVKLDSQGPVFYIQERVGRFGDVFRIYKFRTMRVDSEARGPVWAAGECDPRMTRLGAVLRRTHLDELPQLYNVLMGDMSLVGPRPERPYFAEELDRAIPRYGERLLIKPGMTGLAQVHYQYDQSIADVRRKLRFDLLYIRRMGFALDMQILLWTVAVVVTGRGIH